MEEGREKGRREDGRERREGVREEGRGLNIDKLLNQRVRGFNHER